ncbi:MAG TPA: EamA family transporter [Streptosporangiaceae bacterium]|nr:EamA family transporter [Streptosporangiaceae bacterium]
MNALLALAASALWGTSDFGGGLISRRLDPSAAVLISQALALAGLLVLLPFLAVPVGPYLLTGAAAGVVATLSLAAFYRAMATAPMSLVAPITAAGTVIPVVAGMIKGEQLTVVKLAGIAVTLAGIVLASGPEFGSGAAVRRQALGFAIAAAVGFGLAYTLLSFAAGTSVYGALLCQRIGGLVVLSPIVARTRILREVHLTARRVGALALIGGCDITANGAYALAASRGNLSVAAVLASLYPVVTALLARGILAERLRYIQNIGVLAALAGVLLLSS